MQKTKEFLKEMISAPGLSGHEAPIRSIVEAAWKPLADELSVSKLGSLHALKKGNGSRPRKSLLVATHMDAIGLIVTRVKDCWLGVTQIGGVDPRVLPGQLVTVHGREDLPGLVVQPPAHCLPKDARKGAVPLEHLLVDTALTARETANKVKVGDLVSFASPPVELDGDYLSGHSLDNRASVAALTEALQLLQTRVHAWDLWAVATVQEEETLGGAATSAFALRPTLAVAVDVTFAKGSGSPAHASFDMDKGPVLGWGPNVHPKLYTAFKDLAERLEIPIQKEPLPRMSGTDAIALQVAAEGVPTMVVSIPLRYMHTPVEMIQVKDVTRTGRLLAEFLAGLDEAFMDKLRWVSEKD